ncbi:MAG: hypothetical protein RIR04_2144 [Pseudomonadota bacterium]
MQSPVPMFVHSLTALSKILDKAEAFAEAKKIKPEVIPQLRLIADMLPFWRQITIACDHAKGAPARLAGMDVPSFADTETTIAELKERIAKTIAFISTIPDAAFDGAEARTITVKAGPRELSFPAPQYLASYAIPNFYFHMSTAYSILRANGVEVGKVDFLGG